MVAKSPAQILIEKADKKANSSGGWFASATTKYEEAGDLYQQAANAFKIDKLFKEAGDAHAREAECREKSKEINEAANAWWNAAKAYKRGYPDRTCSSFLFYRFSCSVVAIAALSQTITFLTQGGRFRQAADREKEIGQIYLQEKQDMRKACESYERAGEWYSQEDATAYVYRSFTLVARSFNDPGLPMHASRTLQTFMQSWRITLQLSLVTNRLLTHLWVRL